MQRKVFPMGYGLECVVGIKSVSRDTLGGCFSAQGTCYGMDQGGGSGGGEK